MQTRTPFAAWFALAVLSAVMLYAVVDGSVLSLLAQPLKIDLHLNDTQFGSLRGLGSALFGAIAVVPLGWLADKIDRRLLLALCVLVWSVAVASCGVATGYTSLLMSVAFLAAGEASLSPVAYALIPELFGERRRMTANFIFYAAAVLGGGAGLAIAGAVIDHIGLVVRWSPNGLFTRETWRLVFFVVAAPGPLLALAMGLIRLKRRLPQARPEAVGPTIQDRGILRSHLESHWKAIVGVFGTYGLARLGAGAIFTWLPVILTRGFALSAGQVGAGLGAAITVGTVLGLLIAAVGANFLKSKWGAVTPIRLPQFGYLIFGLLIPLYLLVRSPTEIFVIAAVQMAAATASLSLMPTVMQNLAPAPLRGRVLAISMVIATLVQVVSPIAVGLLSDHVFTREGGLLISSVAVGAPCLLLAAAMLWLAEKQILKTVGEVQTLSDVPESGSPPGLAAALGQS